MGGFGAIGPALYGFEKGVDDQQALNRKNAVDDFNLENAKALAPIQRQAAQTTADTAALNLDYGRQTLPSRVKSVNDQATMYGVQLRDLQDKQTRDQLARGISAQLDRAKRGWLTTGNPASFGDFWSHMSPEGETFKVDQATDDNGQQIINMSGDHGTAMTFGGVGTPMPNIDPKGELSAIDKMGVAAHLAADPNNWESVFNARQKQRDAMELEGSKQANRLDVARETGASRERAAAVRSSTAGGSRQQQYAEWRVAALMQGGYSEKDAKRIVAAGSASVARPVDVTRLAQSLMKMKRQDVEHFGEPLYPDMDSAMKAARDALAGAQSGGAPTPGAPAGEPASAPSSSGWTVKRLP